MTENLTRRRLLASAALGAAGIAFVGSRGTAAPAGNFPYHLTDAQWRAKLPGPAYEVLRHEDTERPFTSPLLNEHRVGDFACRGCGQHAYASRTKFESGTGWPSFWAPITGAVATRNDSSLGMERTEVHCSRCGGHLGHVFDDGPRPTGKRYCMNGVAMTFVPKA